MSIKTFKSAFERFIRFQVELVKGGGSKFAYKKWPVWLNPQNQNNKIIIEDDIEFNWVKLYLTFTWSKRISNLFYQYKKNALLFSCLLI